jgi:hypothetical protein
MGKSSTVHATDCELNDANGLGRQQVIETRAFDIDWLLSTIVLAGSQSELASGTLTEHIDI